MPDNDPIGHSHPPDNWSPPSALMLGKLAGQFSVQERDYGNAYGLTFDNRGNTEGRPRTRYSEQIDNNIKPADLVRQLRNFAAAIEQGESTRATSTK